MLETLSLMLQEQGLKAPLAAKVAFGLLVFGAIILAITANIIAKRIILQIVHTVIRKSRSTWDDVLLERRVFSTLSHIAPAVVFYLLAPAIFIDYPLALSYIQRAAIVYMIVVTLLVIDSLLNAILEIYRRYSVSSRIPILGYVQVGKIIVNFLGVIFIIATLTQKPPWGLLTGLGALTAILMLVFKDVILGLVASVQLSTNDMLRRGDWLEMPSFGADGDVIDISLAVVKVRNWDKTITTIPTYALVSNSFRNWRGMQESGGRRIKRALNIDMNSVRFLTPEDIERFKNIKVLREYLENKQQELDAYNKKMEIDDSTLVNGRRMTNLGTFRAYVIAYLRNHPQVHDNMTFLVRHLAPTPQGIPIEVYVFSRDQRWAHYEAIQADIFDHLLAVVPEFDLAVFQEPAGRDFRSLLSAAKQ